MTDHGQRPSAVGRDIFAERYAESRARLSPAFQRVVDFIDANRLDVLTSSALDIATAAGTSDATVIRALRALGFAGLDDLKAELTASFGVRNSPAGNLARSCADVGGDAEAAMDDVLAALQSGIELLRSADTRKSISDALKVLHVADRIVVFGIGPTAHIAGYFAARLRRKGRRQLVLDRTGAGLADQLLELERGDAILMLAYGKSYAEAEATAFEAQLLRLPIVLVTDGPDTSLAKHAKVVVPVHRGRVGRIALQSSTVSCLEMLLLGLATVDGPNALETLGELNRLRERTRSSRRVA